MTTQEVIKAFEESEYYEVLMPGWRETIESVVPGTPKSVYLPDISFSWEKNFDENWEWVPELY